MDKTIKDDPGGVAVAVVGSASEADFICVQCDAPYRSPHEAEECCRPFHFAAGTAGGDNEPDTE